MIEPPSTAARDRALVLLGRSFGPSKLLTSRDACERFVRDESEAEGQVPDAVVLAESPADVLDALRVAREARVPITPRAGGTGRTGGSVPVLGGIVLSLLGMRQIKEIDRREGIAVVEPGVALAALHEAVEREGWFYPPDPSSLVDCTLGGNVAENAGGPRAFKYGVTGDYVLGIEAMLIGGQRLLCGRRTRKGVTGYQVTELLVGSEGTLAVFGDLTLRLVPKPPDVMTLMGLFVDVRRAAQAVELVTGRGLLPRSIEFFDAGSLEVMRDAGNPLDVRANAMLMLDVDGAEEECERQATQIAALCEEAGALEVLAAEEASQRDRLWAARRELSPAVRRLTRFKQAEDVVVPRQRSVEFLGRVAETSERLGVRSLCYGHAGDGNYHVNFLWDDPDDRPRVERAIEQLFRDTVELGGTLSGEHGIGVLKAPYLGLEQSSALIGLQRDLKRVFDPEGWLNPGKIFPPD
jgi:glycolate oxidase